MEGEGGRGTGEAAMIFGGLFLNFLIDVDITGTEKIDDMRTRG